MNKSLAVILTIFGLCYLGCASVPETSTIDPTPYYDQIKEGVSTKQDVLALFGEPTHVHVSTPPSGEIWAYGCFKTKDTFRPVTFNFNQSGVVTYKSISVFDISWPPKQPMVSVTRHTDITQ